MARSREADCFGNQIAGIYVLHLKVKDRHPTGTQHLNSSICELAGSADGRTDGRTKRLGMSYLWSLSNELIINLCTVSRVVLTVCPECTTDDWTQVSGTINDQLTNTSTDNWIPCWTICTYLTVSHQSLILRYRLNIHKFRNYCQIPQVKLYRWICWRHHVNIYPQYDASETTLYRRRFCEIQK